MIRRIALVLLLVPLAIFIVMLAVANRHSVLVSLDPFSTEAPALSRTVPLFAIMLVALIGGTIIGGTAAWVRQGKWRRAARRNEAELRKLQSELHALRQHHRAAGEARGLPAPQRSTALTYGRSNAA